jgi:hypothetical protein
LSPDKPVLFENTRIPTSRRSKYVPNIQKASKLGLRIETALPEAIIATAKAVGSLEV